MNRPFAIRRPDDPLVAAGAARSLRARVERVRRPHPTLPGHGPRWAHALGVPALVALALALTLALSAQSPTRVSSEAPILNWRLPSFTPEGFRESLVRGTEARLLADGNVDLTDLTLTLFSRDASNRVETILLSQSARVLSRDRAVTGDGAIRVINDQFEATGLGWRYDHETKKVSLRKNVRVVFRAELTDILQ